MSVSSRTSKYEKIICDLNAYVMNELKIKLDDKLKPLINEINQDNYISNELDNINDLISKFPFVINLQKKYNFLLEENVILKKK